MIVESGDIFEQKCDAVAITTNGYFTFEGRAVMGRGVALQAAEKWPFIKKRLGYMLQLHGVHVYVILEPKNGRPYHVVNFPVKPAGGIFNGTNIVKTYRSKFAVGSPVPGWMMKADLKLIQRSAEELVELTDARGWERVCLPKPGCGAGELKWDVVKLLLKDILKGKRFVVVDNGE